MGQVTGLLKTLKRQLRSRNLTYADVAAHLGLSQSSVKRLFSAPGLSLGRLEQVCQLMGLEVSDLVRIMEEETHRIARLSEQQEREIANNPKLLLVATCTLHGWTFEEMVATYQLEELECVRLLAQLDRLAIIELLPLNRYKLIVAKNFSWQPDGPIQRFFQQEVQADFLQSSFSGAGEKLVFRSGMLSRGSNAALIKKIDRLAVDFETLHDEDSSLSLDQRFGSSLLVALRPWEFDAFHRLRRHPDEKSF